MLEFFLTLIVSSPFDLEFLDSTFPDEEECIKSGEALLVGLDGHELLIDRQVKEYVGYLCTPKAIRNAMIDNHSRRDL